MGGFWDKWFKRFFASLQTMIDLIQGISFHQGQGPERPYFSVLIPTWNNLPMLQTCLRSLRTHSRVPLQIVVIANEGSDGTREWLATQPDLDWVEARRNLGVCYGLNSARSLVRAPYLLFLNDDMYVLPGWDLALQTTIDALGHDAWYLSATMIEPARTRNRAVIVADHGRDLATFDEAGLLATYAQPEKPDWMGATWPPSVLPVALWDLVGGLSVEYSPGMYSDPDLSRKLYAAGVRHFQGVGDSRVYHFGSASTRRVRKNRGKAAFLLKWGHSSRHFTRGTLRMGAPFAGPVGELPAPGLLNRLKRAWAAIRRLDA